MDPTGLIMVLGLFPENRDHLFFAKLEGSAALLQRGGDLLVELLTGFSLKNSPLPGQIQEVEEQLDTLARETYELLDSTFITPLNREEIFFLNRQIDGVMDLIFELTTKIYLYKVPKILEDFLEQARTIQALTNEIKSAVGYLKSLKSSTSQIQLKSHLDKIDKLENDAEKAYLRCIENLFATEKDPIMVIKWKELVELLERAADGCKRLGNLIQSIRIKNV